MTTLPGTIPGPPGRARAWLLASRPPTLTAAVAPVIVGTAVAVRADAFAAGPALAALLGAIALQVGANFANDVSDFRRGADHAGRLGPPRAAAMGMLSETAIVRGMLAAFAIAAVLGLYLASVVGWPIIVVGVASIAAAVTYTGGPWPYGYRALGELFVFAFFGLVAVAGTYYAQAGALSREALAAAIPVGFTVTAILVVNNVRDIESDRVAHKYTLAVYLGRRLARGQYLATVAGAYVAATALWLVGGFSPGVLLVWLSLPAMVGPARAVLTQTDGPPLNAALRATARLHFVFAVLLAVGVLW
ncbi:MAG: 1,4-dihydroxy-2-naphthoate polyprenyltransferase [Chloroflexi bacterium]|nr:1,4-dihydroxy-2-naphthoate polyprenyltransferase [Chloroflexota bacterium]MQC27759.1 1,4-dihydroxy-2-naphthoate polyprenyltransferase [Chloroflexota bacterium]